MAKYKVGDKIRERGNTVGHYAYPDRVFTVKKVDKSTGWITATFGGKDFAFREINIEAANSTSTNPVVANALAARVCNGINDWWGFSKGDKVRAKYWKDPKAVGIVTGLASMGVASDGSDTFLSVDFPTEKNVPCSIKELVKNSAAAHGVARNADGNTIFERAMKELSSILTKAEKVGKLYEQFDREIKGVREGVFKIELWNEWNKEPPTGDQNKKLNEIISKIEEATHHRL